MSSDNKMVWDARTPRTLETLPSRREALERMIRHFGATPLYEHSTHEPLYVHWCPFTAAALGIVFSPTPTLVFDGASCPGAIIHELGHLCVTRNTHSPEWYFFGWEFAAATEFGFVDEWLLHMHDYGVDAGYSFGDLSVDSQSEVIEERWEAACRSGLIVGGCAVSRIGRTV